MDTKIISLRTPHLILAGTGALERLGQEAKALGATKALVVTDKGVARFEILIPGSTNNLMDPIMIGLTPGEELATEGPHAGEEFGYVLSGVLTLILGKKVHKVPPKHCFYFEAEQAHQFVNRGKMGTNFLWVTSPPQM